jgi:hypothetical protein
MGQRLRSAEFFLFPPPYPVERKPPPRAFLYDQTCSQVFKKGERKVSALNAYTRGPGGEARRVRPVEGTTAWNSRRAVVLTSSSHSLIFLASLAWVGPPQ